MRELTITCMKQGQASCYPSWRGYTRRGNLRWAAKDGVALEGWKSKQHGHRITSPRSGWS